MPTKKETFFSVTGREPDPVKLPTLKQFLKENNALTFPHLSGIEIIWLPGQWDNYSLNTSTYRASIANGHGLYSALDSDVIRIFGDTSTQVLLGIEDNSGLLRFVESNVYGAYDRIGNAGFRWKPTDGAN